MHRRAAVRQSVRPGPGALRPSWSAGLGLRMEVCVEMLNARKARSVGNYHDSWKLEGLSVPSGPSKNVLG